MSSHYLTPEYPTTSKRNNKFSRVGKNICTRDLDMKIYLVQLHAERFYRHGQGLFHNTIKTKMYHLYHYSISISTMILNTNLDLITRITYLSLAWQYWILILLSWFDPQKSLANSSAAAGPRRENLTKGFLSWDRTGREIAH